MNKPRYYIVVREHLGEYGDESGVATIAEANRLLDDAKDDVVVIKGRELPVVHRIYAGRLEAQL